MKPIQTQASQTQAQTPAPSSTCMYQSSLLKSLKSTKRPFGIHHLVVQYYGDEQNRRQQEQI